MARKSKVAMPPMLRASGFVAVFVGSALALISLAVGGGAFYAGLAILAVGVLSLLAHYVLQGGA